MSDLAILKTAYLLKYHIKSHRIGDFSQELTSLEECVGRSINKEGACIHTFMFTDCKNKRFFGLNIDFKRNLLQKTNI